MATAGFELRSYRQKQPKEKFTSNIPPSAFGLINKSKVIKRCCFCNGFHLSINCYEAKKLTLSECKQKLNDKGCCHSCLKVGHIARRCRSSPNLNCTNCSGKHVLITCPKNVEDKPKPESSKATTSSSSTVENTLSNNTYGEVFLQTLLVRMNGFYKSRSARVIINTGSKRSYITKMAASEMEYTPIRHEQLVHALFGGSNTEVINHTCYNIRLCNLNDMYACNFEALDQNVICQNVSCIKQGPWIEELNNLNIDILDTKPGCIDILIGADICGKLFTGNRHVLNSGLVAVETLLGWTLMGKVPTNQFNTDTLMINTSLLNKDFLLSELWQLDAIGINDPVESEAKRSSSEAVMNHFLSTVSRREDGRYEVSMPWVEGHPFLPSNYEISRKRLEKLIIKLKEEAYLEKYNEVFQDWLKEGIIESVSDKGTKIDGHYLPHRHVVKLSSQTTKSPVFDASAKQKGYPSLNQCLEKGIHFLELIPNLLIKFRLNKIGVISDIKKAFLQISLIPSDRNFLKFLWYENDCLKTFRHTRVIFGATCSSFMLSAVIIFHLQNILSLIDSGNILYSKCVIMKLLESFYVDNCVTSLSTLEEVHSFINESSSIFLDAQMKLRGWEYTNIDDYSCDNISLSSVLGLDTLELNLSWLNCISTNSVTKRNILSTAHRLFDPIGIISPTSLYPKLLLQKTWSLKIGWDVEVKDEIKNNYLNWLQELPILTHLRIPRWVLTTSYASNWSIHVFCDASQHAYATAIFLRSETNHDVNVQLVISKSRVSPVKKITIPRAELLAACIGARLSKVVKDNIPYVIYRE